MANINNNNFNIFKLKLNKDEYWDITLNKDMHNLCIQNYKSIAQRGLIVYFDFEQDVCYGNHEVKSLDGYSWENAYANEHELTNVGYTAFDNGLLFFERDKILNKDFVDLYQNSKYKINSIDTSLKLHFVTGSTKQYDYDYEIDDKYIKLNGGFLQGFFKTECDKYEVLPSMLQNDEVWTFEFTLNKQVFAGEKNKTLNEKYKSNKGIFFYIGVRSENKWIYLYDDYDNELTYDEYIEDGEIDIKSYKLSGFTNMFDEYVDDDMDISNIKYGVGNNTISLDAYEEYIDIKNPFLLLDRTQEGLTVDTWDKNSCVRYVNKKNNFKENLFLLLNRTTNGYTVDNINDIKQQYDKQYDIYADLWNNALAFRITDEGQIGYRFLTQSENNEDYAINEAYSLENIIKDNEWMHIVVKVIGENETMKLKFYVNGKLVFISKSLPKLNLRPLNEIYEKQETIPYNISIGGGTQGLAETILPNYMVDPYKTLPLEKHFAGTFIGYIKSFKMYNTDLSYNEINQNFNVEMNEINK